MKKVYETALHVAAFRSIISPPTRTHIMKTIYGTKITRIILTTSQLAIAKAKSSKSTFQTSSANAMTDLNEKILRWADDKGILANGTPEGQLSKTLEEIIETAQAVALYELFSNEECLESACDDALDAVKDGVGDVYVTLVIHAKLAGYEFSSRERANCADAMTNKYILNEFSIWLPALVRNESPEMMSRTMIFLLHGLAMNHGLTLRECVEHSYNVIAKRTGKMQDGVFVKNN